eukprot:TRINITY_DN1795_c0_g1_i2.p1 TRINITY_DN1795_c0_g1~~TRINITY_DN1795_c0_g1_i2.p1  ORF type:complete len:287 (+),score=89.62 TRINITY_DN1795_c0_g1_i2:96-863(+)
MSLTIDWSPGVTPTLQTNCLKCKIPQKFNETQAQFTRAVTLQDCVNLFIASETLGPEDPWFCPVCKNSKQATKKFDLWKLPEVLIVHLKRFSYGRYTRQKLDTIVDFPVDSLDLSHFVPHITGPSPIYELYAISNHHGGLGGGHYTAYCRNKDDNKWYHFDDSSCAVAHADSIKGPAAYLLLYRRKSPPAGHPPASTPGSGPTPATTTSTSPGATATATATTPSPAADATATAATSAPTTTVSSKPAADPPVPHT